VTSSPPFSLPLVYLHGAMQKKILSVSLNCDISLKYLKKKIYVDCRVEIESIMTIERREIQLPE